MEMSQFARRRWSSILSGVAFVAFAALGCNGGDETPENPVAPSPPPATAAPQSLLRAATLTEDAPTVDVSINGEVVFRGIHYPGVSEYTSFATGAHQVRFLRAGTPKVLAEATISLGVGEQLTVAVLGLFGLEIQEIRDNLNGNPDRARIKLFNAVPDFPDKLDLWNLNGPPIIQEIAYRETSGYAELEPGFYNLELVRFDTRKQIATALGGSLAGNSTLTAFAVGTLRRDDIELLVVRDSF
jgi:hypothetical protein